MATKTVPVPPLGPGSPALSAFSETYDDKWKWESYSDLSSVYSNSNASTDSFATVESVETLPPFRLRKQDGHKQSVYEAWNVYLSPDTKETISGTKLFGFDVAKRYDAFPGVTSVTSELYTQQELMDMHLQALDKYQSTHKRCLPTRLLRGNPQTYEANLDTRIRTLPDAIQSEVNRLLADREAVTSNRFHSRAWTVVLLREQLHRRFADAEPTVVEKGHKVRFWKNTKVPKGQRLEYFVVIRGTEGTRPPFPENDEATGKMHDHRAFKRYENPWKHADEAEIRRRARERRVMRRQRLRRRYASPPAYRARAPPSVRVPPSPMPPPPMPAPAPVPAFMAAPGPRYPGLFNAPAPPPAVPTPPVSYPTPPFVRPFGPYVPPPPRGPLNTFLNTSSLPRPGSMDDYMSGPSGGQFSAPFPRSSVYNIPPPPPPPPRVSSFDIPYPAPTRPVCNCMIPTNSRPAVAPPPPPGPSFARPSCVLYDYYTAPRPPPPAPPAPRATVDSASCSSLSSHAVQCRFPEYRPFVPARYPTPPPPVTPICPSPPPPPAPVPRIHPSGVLSGPTTYPSPLPSELGTGAPRCDSPLSFNGQLGSGTTVCAVSDEDDEDGEKAGKSLNRSRVKDELEADDF